MANEAKGSREDGEGWGCGTGGRESSFVRGAISPSLANCCQDVNLQNVAALHNVCMFHNVCTFPGVVYRHQLEATWEHCIDIICWP